MSDVVAMQLLSADGIGGTDACERDSWRMSRSVPLFAFTQGQSHITLQGLARKRLQASTSCTVLRLPGRTPSGNSFFGAVAISHPKDSLTSFVTKITSQSHTVEDF